MQSSRQSRIEGTGSTYETIEAILRGLGIAAGDISSEALLRRDLELDSTELVEVTLEIRRRLGVDVKLESAADLSVADVCRLVAESV